MFVRVWSRSTALALVLTATAMSAHAQEADSTATRAAVLGEGDIVVTARKRAENVQDIPIAISAFSGASIEARGIDKIDGIATFTPNMSFQNNPSFGGASSSADRKARCSDATPSCASA